MFHTVGELHRVGDLEEYDRVDLHGNVVLGDHCLRLEVYDLFLNGNPLCHAVDERYQKVDTGAPRLIECTQTFYDVDICLRYNANSCDKNHNDENSQK